MPEDLNQNNAAESGGDPTGKTGSEPGGQGASATDRGPAAKAGQDGGKGSGSADGELTLEEWKARAEKAEKERDHYQNRLQDREKYRRTGAMRSGKSRASDAGDDDGAKPQVGKDGKPIVDASGKPEGALSEQEIEQRVRDTILVNDTEDEVREYAKKELGVPYDETNEIFELLDEYARTIVSNELKPGARYGSLDIADQKQLAMDVLAGRHQHVLIDKAHKAGYDQGYKAGVAKLNKLLPGGGGGTDVPGGDDGGKSQLTPSQRQLQSTIDKFSKPRKAG